MSAALFGSSGSAPRSKNLVEFKAGKMTMKGKMVSPDKRKGQVYVYQTDDQLMHFCWKDRTKGTVEDDLIIFPDDTEYKHVAQCTTGRVYLLKFKSSSRKFFFWMQEPKSDKDEEYCKKVNEYLNNPPAPGQGSSGGSGGGGLPAELSSGLGVGEGDLQNLLGNMSQQQLMQLLGNMGMGGVGGLSSLLGGGRPSSADSAPPSRVQSSPGPRASQQETTPQQPRPGTASATPSQSSSTTSQATESAPTATAASATPSAPGQPSIQLSDLQNILTGMGVDETAQKDGVAIDLSKAISPDVMIPILANPQVQERLVPLLPEGELLPKTEEELKSTVQSPQFQQAMSAFSAALASGQLAPLMGQFNLGEEVQSAATQGDVEAFVKAMQKKKDDMDDDEEKL